jgi:hypothetical protein
MEAPKRPPSAYFVFMSSVRAELKAAHPGASTGALAKLAGERWAALTPAEKAPHEVSDRAARGAPRARR